ncbi:hypothetical protein J437_LFUL018102 [Ladona fulva]|uniref:Uncharacterized protein n=1 Tax=Ladona fulva TaxID=123851 RepID=A0A8K0P8Z8_LADFU|nr:hypothetical protein J437_LFUL018102 [Ladona fulva]
MPAPSKSFFLSPCLESELKSVIHNLGSKFSSGPDEIPKFLPAASYEFIRYPLLFLLNWSLQHGIFPEPLKLSKVLPIYKKKCNIHDINSYRPISILNSFKESSEGLSITLALNVKDEETDNVRYGRCLTGYGPRCGLTVQVLVILSFSVVFGSDDVELEKCEIEYFR